jgi:hypothetical protein
MKEGNRNRQLVTAVAFLFVGMIGIWGMGSSAFARYRPVDVLRMLAAGACLGVAIMAIAQYFRAPRPGGT